METTVDRIKQYIDFKGISIRKFEENLGFSNGSFASQYKNNKTIGVDKVENILHYYSEINPAWLLTGEGDMIKRYPNSLTPTNTKKEQLVPFYNQVASAGKVQLFKDFTLSNANGYISVPNMPKCDGAVPIVGDSMYPLLKSGDIVCYKLKEPGNIIYGEMYLIDWHDGDGDDYLMAKFIAKSTIKNHITLVSHNKHHDDLDIPKSNIRQLALIKLSVRFNTH